MKGHGTKGKAHHLESGLSLLALISATLIGLIFIAETYAYSVVSQRALPRSIHSILPILWFSEVLIFFLFPFILSLEMYFNAPSGNQLIIFALVLFVIVLFVFTSAIIFLKGIALEKSTKRLILKFFSLNLFIFVSAFGSLFHYSNSTKITDLKAFFFCTSLYFILGLVNLFMAIPVLLEIRIDEEAEHELLMKDLEISRLQVEMNRMKLDTIKLENMQASWELEISKSKSEMLRDQRDISFQALMSKALGTFIEVKTREVLKQRSYFYQPPIIYQESVPDFNINDFVLEPREPMAQDE
jgi:hypothetical protein